MKIIVNGVNLEIGDNTFIGNFTMITGSCNTVVKIGGNCDISDRVNIFTGTHHIGTIEHAAGEGYGKNVLIGDGVWIGLGASILPGVKIGNGAIIASCACVNKDIESGVLATGVPAKMKKRVFEIK